MTNFSDTFISNAIERNWKNASELNTENDWIAVGHFLRGMWLMALEAIDTDAMAELDILEDVAREHRFAARRAARWASRAA